MKKLVTAACALVAGMVLAEGGIESANIVGYIEKGFTPEQNNDAVATFGMVGGEDLDGNIVLGDITANDDFSIVNGDVLMVYIGGEEQFQASYFSRDLLDSIGYETTAEGWWDVEAAGDMSLLEDPTYCYNDFALAAGQGFTVSPASDDAGLIFPDPLTLNDKN